MKNKRELKTSLFLNEKIETEFLQKETGLNFKSGDRQIFVFLNIEVEEKYFNESEKLFSTLQKVLYDFQEEMKDKLIE